MRTRIAFCAILALSALACSRSPDRREYRLHGQIISMAADRKEANIKHDAIEGFMPAMTMPYKVRDEQQLSSLVPGDIVDATLVVVSNDAYLEDVKKVGNQPLETPPKEPPAPTTSLAPPLLKPGEPVPVANFVNQDGKAVRLNQFRGDALVVTFIYTNCPMPTFCPLMDQHFAEIQKKLKETGNSLQVHLLSVSFDPSRDTPAVLKKHADKLGADPRLWSFLTGDRDEIDQWASRFGVTVSRALNDENDITHNLRTVIIDRQGNLVQSYTGNEWTPGQVLADVQVMVGVD